MKQLDCGKAPCKSCPYRKDVPSGVWAKNEYDKLPGYDGNIIEQIPHGTALFYCHQQDGKLCAGWLGAHGPHNLLAVRLAALSNRVSDAVLNYVSPVPVFSTGKEAAAHGKRAIRRPNNRAKAMVQQLLRKRRRTG